MSPVAATGNTNVHVPVCAKAGKHDRRCSRDQRLRTPKCPTIVQDGRGTPSPPETRSVKPIQKYRSQPRPSKASSCRQMILASMLVRPSKPFHGADWCFRTGPSSYAMPDWS
jgi:hypothetical protein